MAFNSNYGYNPYVNPYASPYNAPQAAFNQPMQFNPQAQQMAQQASQQAGSGFVWVNDINEAANYMVAPNSAVQLWDKNSPCVYLKTADAAGKPTMQIFDLVERKTPQNAVQQASDGNSDFICRKEFDELKSRVEALAAKKPAKVKVITEDDDNG